MEQMEATFMHVPPYKEIELLYTLLNEDPEFLHAFDNKHFVDTPLHLAAGEGRTQLALEIQRLMPSFGKKLNAAGWSPLHLALQRGHGDTVRAMVRLNPELVGVQGREGITPLHYAAETDAVNMVGYFLMWWPESIEKLTVREETAVHLAVRNRKLAAFNVLLGWVKRKSKRRVVLTWMDLDGNTVWHLAASTNQPQVLDALVGVVGKIVNWMNDKELTALDIVMQLPRYEDNEKALSILGRCGAKPGSSFTISSYADKLSSNVDFLTFIGTIGEYLEKGLSAEMRSTALVVAGLIVNTTYQAILTPPTIVANQNPILTLNTTAAHNSSLPFDLLQAPPAAFNISRQDLMGRKVMFAGMFMLPNTVALAAAIGTVFLMLPSERHNLFLHVSIVSLMCSTLGILGSIQWLQPDSEAGTSIALFAFGVITVVLMYIKLSLLISGDIIRGRLTVRGHRLP